MEDPLKQHGHLNMSHDNNTSQHAKADGGNFMSFPSIHDNLQSMTDERGKVILIQG